MRNRFSLSLSAVVLATISACGSGAVPATQPTGSQPATSAAPTSSLAGESASPVPTADDSHHTSYDLLNAAQARGELDQEQALVYKVFASFGDTRLPAAYRGDDTELHDGMVLTRVLARWDKLSPTTQETLRPFTLWPGEADSWLQQRMAKSGWMGGGPVAVADAKLLPIATSPHVQVWVREDRPEDEAKARAIAAWVDGEIWPKLTGLMGPPLSDLGLGNPEGNGEDGRIDIVLSGENIRSKTRPLGCPQGSAFITLGLSGTNLAVVSHELMHAIQFKYQTPSACDAGDYIWLHESAAQWAIDFVDPTTQGEFGAGDVPKGSFLDTPEYPLELTNDDHEYGGYLFWQYIAHSYSTSYVPAVWEAFGNKDLLGAIDQVLASSGGLTEVWPDFALAAYNVDPSRRFQDWDEMRFGAKTEQRRVSLYGTHSTELIESGHVEHMAASYYAYQFEDPAIKKVTFTHSYAGNADARVTVIAKFEGEDWKVEDWTPFAEKKFCYDDPGQKRLEQLVTIVSNSTHEGAGQALSGTAPKLKVEDTCADLTAEDAITVVEEAHLDFSHDDVVDGSDDVSSWRMTVKLERDPNDPRGYMATSGEWTLEYAYDFWETYPGCVSSVKMAASLGGNWNDENWFKLSYDPQTLAGYVQIAITPRGTYEEHNAICGNAAQTVPHEASESMGSTGWTLEVQGQRQGDGIRFVLDQNVVGSDTPDNRSFTTITGGILLTP